MVLEDKVALVTGAGQGMGRAIAMALAGEGATVALVEINAEALEGRGHRSERAGKPYPGHSGRCGRPVRHRPHGQ